MGSGKGTTKRVSNTAANTFNKTERSKILYDNLRVDILGVETAQWEQDCIDKEIQDNSIVDHYLGKHYKGDVYDNDLASYVFTETLHDVLAGGYLLSINGTHSLDNYKDYAIKSNYGVPGKTITKANGDKSSVHQLIYVPSNKVIECVNREAYNSNFRNPNIPLIRKDHKLVMNKNFKTTHEDHVSKNTHPMKIIELLLVKATDY